MRRFLIVIIISLLFIQNVNSQRIKRPKNLPTYDRKSMHFGFTLGINSYFKPNESEELA